MKKRKKKIKVKKLILFIFIIITLIFISFMLFNKTDNKLEKIGYSSLEIQELEKLSDKELNTIYKYDYNKNLIYIVKSENYNKNKLDLYINYTSETNILLVKSHHLYAIFQEIVLTIFIFDAKL